MSLDFVPQQNVKKLPNACNSSFFSTDPQTLNLLGRIYKGQPEISISILLCFRSCLISSTAQSVRNFSSALSKKLLRGPV
ncbi:MAG: hypothetical protein CVV41_19035 [Candidatus Riflebacteria bacterium HGW-Riflebacteria-1]|nr:MAG: hypothetical protein CVV41_19035 [Candidatus Riflebacteria bacterium HGW-Riflebacteria-1]